MYTPIRVYVFTRTSSIQVQYKYIVQEQYESQMQHNVLTRVSIVKFFKSGGGPLRDIPVIAPPSAPIPNLPNVIDILTYAIMVGIFYLKPK